MADGISFDASQVNALSVDLAGAPLRVVKRVDVAIRKSAADIERDGKLLSPVDTGFMRNSISSTVRGLSAAIGPTAEYAPYVEDGTSSQAPQPFMGPAFDRNVPLFIRAVEIAGEEATL